MQQQDKPQFLEVLNGLAAIKGKPLAIEALNMWWMAMQDWSIDDFKNAAAHLLKTCQFMPTPYDFNQLKKSSKETPDEAWSMVLDACKESQRTITPFIDKVVKSLGGYHQIGLANIETALPHIRRNFIEAYQSMDDVDTTRGALPELLPNKENLERLKLAMK